MDQSEKEFEEQEARKSVDDEWAETLGVRNNVDSSRRQPQVADDLSSQPGGGKAAGDAENQKPWMKNRPEGYFQPGFSENADQRFGRSSQSDYRAALRNATSHFEQPAEPMPHTWLVWSVVCALLFSTIPGIIAIVYSAKVSSKYYSGDIEGAKRCSRNAEIWIIISFVVGVIANTLYLPLLIAGWV